MPTGLAVAGAVWAWRTWSVMAGASGRSAFALAVFGARQWRRKVRAARGTPHRATVLTLMRPLLGGAVARESAARWVSAPGWTRVKPLGTILAYPTRSLTNLA
ncbi:hypothetical protein [Trebonia sp.]|uniref:hypothetical protein n=1 Tax=Trebonia sp. TaxID=2767075 RepID=UPI00260EC393|nr:hypothetical protein [Trebonia sp.]